MTSAEKILKPEVWDEEDRRDLTAFSLDYAASRYPEDEDLILPGTINIEADAVVPVQT